MKPRHIPGTFTSTDWDSWRWPGYKFGLSLDDIFTSLWDKYNTIPIALQGKEAFHADVLELSHEAETRDQFFSLMAERRQQRLEEIQICWTSTKLPFGSPLKGGEDDDDTFRAWLHFMAEWTLDSFVRYWWHFRDTVGTPPDTVETPPDTVEAPPGSPGPRPSASHTRSPERANTSSTTNSSSKRKRSSPNPTSDDKNHDDEEGTRPSKRRCSWIGDEPIPPEDTFGSAPHANPPRDIFAQPPHEKQSETRVSDDLAQPSSSPAGPLEDRACEQVQPPAKAPAPRTRKRLNTPATANLADDNEDETRPAKKIRFDDDVIEPTPAQHFPASPPRPTLPRARRARRGQQASVPRPASSVPQAPLEQSATMSSETGLGSINRQHMESASVQPDVEDAGSSKGKNHNKIPAATGMETRQDSGQDAGGPRSRSRKGKTHPRQPPPASPRTELGSSKVQKRTSRSAPNATRTTAQSSHSKSAVHQTRSQRRTRRAGQEDQVLQELDSRGKARSVVLK